MIKLTKEEARIFLLRHQNLYNPRQLRSDRDIVSFIRKVGCIQYDPLNRVARNADLVLQSRCKDYSEDTLYRLLYRTRELIDGWDKNMSILSVQDWPCYSRRRKYFQQRYAARSQEFESVRKAVISRLKKDDYINSSDVDDNNRVDLVDWSWSPTRIGRAVLESMYHRGELTIHHKKGTRKYYGLIRKLIPESILALPDPNKNLSDYNCWCVKRRIRAVGFLWNKSGDAWIGTQLKKEERSRWIKKLTENDEIVEVEVADIDAVFYLDRIDLKTLEESTQYNEASIIAPLDNLIWDRKLTGELFGFDYKWEVYTPAKKRKYGYYVLPLLYGSRFVGRFEPVLDRKTGELHIRDWWWEKSTVMNDDMENALTRCFTSFARFLNVSRIVLSKSISKKGLSWLERCV